MPDEWGDAMIELNGVLEAAKDAKVTKTEVLREVDNVFGEGG